MLRTFSLLLCIFNLVYYVDSQPEHENIFVNDENDHKWTSINFPEPYPKDSSKTLILTVENGYSISIIITSLDIDSEQGDFLIIKPGTTINDQNTGKVFTFTLKDVKKYIVESNSVIMSFRVYGENQAKKRGFSVTYKREGVLITTQTPEIEVTWPTPAESEYIYFTGNVSGRPQNDFNNETVLSNLKSSIAQMAIEYCIAQAIPFIGNITYLNVHLKELISCPYEWPESDTCVKIRFSLPIFLNQSASTTRYELSSKNLELMWNQHADKVLTHISLSVYTPPETSTELRWSLVISVSVILILILIICIYLYSRDPFPLSSSSIANNTDNKRLVTLPPSQHEFENQAFENEGDTPHEPDVLDNNDDNIDDNVIRLRKSSQSSM